MTMILLFCLFPNLQIENQKLNWAASSRVGSLDNAKHKAGGGEKKVNSRRDIDHCCEITQLSWNKDLKLTMIENLLCGRMWIKK